MLRPLATTASIWGWRWLVSSCRIAAGFHTLFVFFCCSCCCCCWFFDQLMSCCGQQGTIWLLQSTCFTFFFRLSRCYRGKLLLSYFSCFYLIWFSKSFCVSLLVFLVVCGGSKFVRDKSGKLQIFTHFLHSALILSIVWRTPCRFWLRLHKFMFEHKILKCRNYCNKRKTIGGVDR